MRLPVKVCAALGIAFAIAASAALAAGYPHDRPVRIVVPFSAGGGTDALARMIAQKMHESWQQPAIVDNRLGAAGTIGSRLVAQSAPDGHTLLMATTSTHGITPNIYRQPGYHPVKDFAPVSLVVWAPNVLVVHPSLPVKSVGDFIKHAKANPGKLLFSSSGTGGSIHLAGELFESLAGVDMTHVPYKGASPAIVDLVAGQTHAMFATVATVLSLIEQGRLRALGVTTPKRSGVLPQIPPIAEAGLPGYEMSGWIGVLAPAKTPPDVIAKINGEVKSLLGNKEARERIAKFGWEPVGSSPEVLGEIIVRELPKYAKIIKDAKMPLQ